VGELLAKQRAHTIVATHEWIENQSCVQANEVIEVTQEELKKVKYKTFGKLKDIL